MHYSSCNCYIGNADSDLCRSKAGEMTVVSGVVLALVGIGSAIFLYILFHGIFDGNLPCFRENKITPINDHSLHTCGPVVSVMDIENDPKKDSALKEGNNTSNRPKHHHCWACEIKYLSRKMPGKPALHGKRFNWNWQLLWMYIHVNSFKQRHLLHLNVNYLLAVR